MRKKIQTRRARKTNRPKFFGKKKKARGGFVRLGALGEKSRRANERRRKITTTGGGGIFRGGVEEYENPFRGLKKRMRGKAYVPSSAS